MNFLLRFQFHKGTIRTRRRSLIFIKDRYFNSIKVQLELMKDCVAWLKNLYFNSIKVQLEQKDSLYNQVQPLKFQFHKGTIRTLC